MDKIITIIIALSIPIIIFILKNFLPALFIYSSNKKIDWINIFIDFIYFPFTFTMMAVSYTLPKTINNIQIWIDWQPIDPNLSSDSIEKIFSDAKLATILNLGFTILVVLAAPFFIALAKNIENSYFKKKKRWIPLLILSFVLAFAAFLFSVKWGM